MTGKLIIDGSHGEGGGQILRSPVGWACFLCPTLRYFDMAADFPITVCRNVGQRKDVAQPDLL